MSQPSVTSYFNTRKRRASEELRNKAKVLILDDHDRRDALGVIIEERTAAETAEHVAPKSVTKMETKKSLVARNLHFELGTKSSKSAPKTRAPRSKKVSTLEESRQPDIRETLLKANKEIEENKRVVFEKLGSLSPKKVQKRMARASRLNHPEKKPQEVQEPSYMRTPTKSSPLKDMSLDEVKTKITTSSRLTELRARIAKFKNCEDKLQNLEQQHKQKLEETKKNEDTVKIKEFERIHLEIPVSPQKSFRSPSKFLSPTKTIQLSPNASPARRLLFEPKEAPVSPVKGSPTKTPAYQRYQVLAEIDSKALGLPYKYRFLSEIYRSVDTVTAMLYNRKELVTFSKLKPAVQELVRRNFTLDHLAQIKTVYPDAFTFSQEKVRSFGTTNPMQYELVITPVIEIDKEKSGRNTPDEDNVLKSAQELHMGPSVLLERRKKFHRELLEIAKDEHEKFLLSLDTPMKIPKEKITRWHPEFDVESCRDIEKAKLPQPPTVEKSTAKEVLERAHNLFNDNSRMKKAIEKLAENRTNVLTPATDVTQTPESMRNVNISIVDTPPATPTSLKQPMSKSTLRGIPLSLLEKVRAKQAAKALEMMTRSKDSDKDALMYSRLPEIAKIIRNIFVSEKKSVLTLEFVVQKLDDSYRTKLTANELEEHIKLLTKLLPLWATLHVVRKTDYLKLAKDFDMVKVIKRLEVLADEKV